MADKAARLGELKKSQRDRPPSQPPHHSTAGTSDPALDAMGSGASPDGSEDESAFSSPGDDVSIPGSPRSSAAHVQVKAESVDSSGARNPSAGGLSMPVQKRRRVTRACDECRRKKIKCDGKQPCTHCSVYSYGKATDALPPPPFSSRLPLSAC